MAALGLKRTRRVCQDLNLLGSIDSSSMRNEGGAERKKVRITQQLSSGILMDLDSQTAAMSNQQVSLRIWPCNFDISFRRINNFTCAVLDHQVLLTS